MVEEETGKNAALELEALEMRILNTALSQRLPTCTSNEPTDEAEKLGEYAKIIAEDAPAQIDESYTLSLQALLCLALRTIDHLSSHQDGTTDRIIVDAQGQGQRGTEKGNNETTALESALMKTKREIELLNQESSKQMELITDLECQLTVTKEKMTDSVSHARSRRSSRRLSDFSLTDILTDDEQAFVVADTVVYRDEVDEANCEMDLIADLHCELAMTKEKMTDSVSYANRRSSRRRSDFSLTDNEQEFAVADTVVCRDEDDQAEGEERGVIASGPCSQGQDMTSGTEFTNDNQDQPRAARAPRRSSAADLTNDNQDQPRAARAPRRSSTSAALKLPTGVSTNGTPITGPLERRNSTGRAA